MGYEILFTPQPSIDLGHREGIPITEHLQDVHAGSVPQGLIEMHPGSVHIVINHLSLAQIEHINIY